MVTITESAKQYLNSVRGDDYVTLGVKGGGCSGFQYVWDLKSNWPDVAELYILGSTVDYVNELGGSFLSVKNPMSTSSCGCGESFGI